MVANKNQNADKTANSTDSAHIPDNKLIANSMTNFLGQKIKQQDAT